MTFVLLSPSLTNNLFFFKTPKLEQNGTIREGKNPKKWVLPCHDRPASIAEQKLHKRRPCQFNFYHSITSISRKQIPKSRSRCNMRKGRPKNLYTNNRCLRAFETIYKTCTLFSTRSSSCPFVMPSSWAKEENQEILCKHCHGKAVSPKTRHVLCHVGIVAHEARDV